MTWIPMLVYAICILFSSRRLMHYLQLESYQFYGYFKTVLRQKKHTVLAYACAGGVIVLIDLLALSRTGLLYWTAVLLPCLIPTVWIRLRGARQPAKKKFVITARVKRLYAAYALCLALLAVLPAVLGIWPVWAGGVFFALQQLLVFIAALAALPVEKLIFHLYFKDAESKLLADKSLIRIGITGSYGKTSTKFILAAILSQKYNVLYTPASFNTPMGVTRVVRERLDARHQVFIGEMGARHTGEIRQLCNLVHPVIGVLTSVGPQHLDTFKTMERIESTKYELIEALPEDGFAVFAHDDAIVTRLYEKTQKPKALAGKQGGDVWADNIRVTGEGSRFTLHAGDWAPLECETRLLGRHNINNILTAAAVARHLGLSREQLARGIASLQPVEHRLQLLRSTGGITIIDDAFNTNPRSSKEALEVLGAFEGRRVIVTPGMVELGSQEEKYNFEFGQAMAGHVDEVMLVGKKHTKPIEDGLIDAGFDKAHIHVMNDLNEVLAFNKTFLRSGDIVMYENDLPDHYAES